VGVRTRKAHPPRLKPKIQTPNYSDYSYHTTVSLHGANEPAIVKHIAAGKMMVPVYFWPSVTAAFPSRFCLEIRL
jgi:hypothetical protein